jgi:RND superfamily putative drug exporter
MASLLYRIGQFSARRAWVVIVAWVAILGLSGGAFALFGGALSSSISIPGTATQRVSDELAEKFPAASGGRGTVVFATTDDSEFTQAQQGEIGNLLTRVAGFDDVSSTTNPFETQAEIDDQAQQIVDGRQQIADGREQIAAGQEELDAAKAQIMEGQAQLDAARAQAEQAGQLEAAQATFDAQQAELDAGKAQIAEQQAQLDAGRAELDEQSIAVEQGSQLLELAAGIRQVSTDGTAAVASIQFDGGLYEIPAESKEAVIDAMEHAGIDGVTVEVSNDIATSIPEILGPGEIGGVIIAAIVLFVMLGTLIGAGLPLLNALIGVGVGVLASLAPWR